MHVNSQKSRKNEAELGAKFRDTVQRLYCVLGSPAFQSGNPPLISSAKGLSESFDRRCALIDAALGRGGEKTQPQSSAQADALLSQTEGPVFRIDELRIRRRLPLMMQ